MKPALRSSERGMTLVELMVGLVLASLIGVFMLSITRTQLMTFERSDQLVKAQQNARAGLTYLESMFRNVCSGMSDGRLAVNVSSVHSNTRTCLRVWDGATISGGTFTTGTTGPDAVEVVLPLNRITSASAASLGTTTPTVTVEDATGFNVGDFVLLTNLGTNSSLFKISTITTTTAPAATFALGPLTAVPQFVGGAAPAAPFTVLRAASIAIYAAATGSTYADMLLLDPDGQAGTGHDDAQPLIEGLQNFQVAVGIDANADGALTDTGGAGDEWSGNATAELPLPAAPWNGTGNPSLRMIRFTLVAKTSNTYSGTAVGPTIPIENGVSPTAGTMNPRYRPMRLMVAPRMWSFTE